MINVCLFANVCLELHPRFAGLDALVPRVTEFPVTSTPAVSVPSTTVAAATAFPGFPDCAAFGARGTDGRRGNDCWCLYVGNDHQNANPKQ